LPGEGDPLEVIVRLAQTGEEIRMWDFNGRLVRTQWTMGNLMEALELQRHLHCDHEACRFLYAGKEASPDQTIENLVGASSCAALVAAATGSTPASVVLTLHVADLDFPYRLGSFLPIPFVWPDLDLPQGLGIERLSAGCCSWRVGAAALRDMNFDAGAEGVVGQCSPVSKLTLDAAARRAFNIPAEAEHVLWSYAIAGWESLEGNDEDLFEAGIQCVQRMSTMDISLRNAVKTFLTVGGFLYLSGSHVVGGVTLFPQQANEDEFAMTGLRFENPRPWNPRWTVELLREGRFHSVTLEALRERGARRYAWLGPGEVILDQDLGVPHGGFAYLFHDADQPTSPADLSCDRYFAAGAVVAPEETGW